MNKDMLNAVEKGLKGEITKQIEAATRQIGTLSERLQVQAKTADTTAETLAPLLEQISALNKNISLIQGEFNRWKEQKQHLLLERTKCMMQRRYYLHQAQHLS